MTISWKKSIRFGLRWGIAVGGIWWVLANMTLRDRVAVLDPTTMRPVPGGMALAAEAGEDSLVYQVVDRRGHVVPVERQWILNEPDRKTVALAETAKSVDVLGVQLDGDINRNPRVMRLLVAPDASSPGHWITPRQVKGGYELRVPHPRVEVGLLTMVSRADRRLLWLAVLIFPITFILTSVRWHKLLLALEIPLTLGKTFVLNMVGAFYNTFIPAGSTGGDVLKAYYAARHTTHRTRAVLSVIIDRVIGLVALIIMGGAAAATYYALSHSHNDPTARACLRVAIGSGLLLLGLGAALAVFFNPTLRRLLKLDVLLARLPMQKQVQNAMVVMAIYRQRPGLMLWALMVTFPVHITVVLSALLAGRALGLPLSSGYYFVVVPVTVLVGAIPISPQGAGVMEFFAIKLTEKQGATVSQAFALTMAIRVVQILWNLTGGVFVLRGSYRAGQAAETDGVQDQDKPSNLAQSSELPAKVAK